MEQRGFVGVNTRAPKVEEFGTPGTVLGVMAVDRMLVVEFNDKSGRTCRDLVYEIGGNYYVDPTSGPAFVSRLVKVHDFLSDQLMRARRPSLETQVSAAAAATASEIGGAPEIL